MDPLTIGLAIAELLTPLLLKLLGSPNAAQAAMSDAFERAAARAAADLQAAAKLGQVPPP